MRISVDLPYHSQQLSPTKGHTFTVERRQLANPVIAERTLTCIQRIFGRKACKLSADRGALLSNNCHSPRSSELTGIGQHGSDHMAQIPTLDTPIEANN